MPQEEPEKSGESPVAWLRKNFWGLLTLIGVTVICVIIVQVFKKPGQMSVIESQAMDMNAMVPPRGAVPVEIARVERQTIAGSVTYTGTVQAFTDEDVYPRITGRITAMPVYAGDRVRKGQLLVQLDPVESSEYSAKREEAASAEDAAMHNAGIAKSEFAQKKYEFEASQEAEKSAQKIMEEAEANLAYWKPELDRQSALLKAQVVSLDEYQKEFAELKAAEAKVEQGRAKLNEAIKAKKASQAAFEAMVHHVGHQSSAVRQARAALKTATIYEKYTKIVAQEDGVVTKRVISPGVVVNPGMLILKIAHMKKVRVQAEVASEDAENIDVGDPVYIKGSEKSGDEIKASVTAVFPAADPASRTITVEALIDNTRGGSASSVSQYKFLPGQYLIMRIVTGQRESLTIPTSAVIWREGRPQAWKVTSGAVLGSENRKYTCIMHPEVISDKPGKCPKCGMDLVPKNIEQPQKKQYTCTMHPEVISDKPGKCPKCGMDLVPKALGGKNIAELVDIEVGLANPDRTELRGGLNEGDEVIFAGHANLQPGVAVIGTEWGKSGPMKLPLASELGGKRLDTSNNFTYRESVGTSEIEVALSPAKGSSNSIVVNVRKTGGGVVSGAQVSVKSTMPGMKMSGPDLSGRTGANGDVRLKSDLMSGLWRLEILITDHGQEPMEISLDVEVP